MTDPLPAELRHELEEMATGVRDEWAYREWAREQLAKYPTPAPAWQPGDVVLSGRRAFQRGQDGWFGLGIAGTEMEPKPGADLIARGGRRVHPARFHDHADLLDAIAEFWDDPKLQRPAQLRAIAADLRGDT